MPASDLGRRLKILLEEPPPNHAALASLVSVYEKFVADEAQEQVDELEHELQKVHNDAVDPSNPEQTEVFLSILHTLVPKLSATSVISRWWEPCLRPAFREPRLPAKTLRHAKALVIHALQDAKTQYSKLVGDFRKRLVDLYLLNTHDDGSADDVLESAEMTQRERDKQNSWKKNLEDILIKHSTDRPTVSTLTRVLVHETVLTTELS